MSTTPSPPAWNQTTTPVLSFAACDPERRIGLPAGRFTTPRTLSALLLGIVLMGVLYGAAWAVKGTSGGAILWEWLTGFSGIPIPIAMLTCWACAILVIKWFKILGQRAALRLRFMPEDPGFVLSDATVGGVIESIEHSVDEPDRFILLARVLSALRSVRNVGRIADIDEMMASSADADEASMESGYTIVRGFIWAIPVLGFIGTIVGLTEAISNFGGVLEAQGGSIDTLTEQLTLVIAGLDTAFVTTGEGLVAALALHLMQTFIRREDERLLDECREYASRNVTARVRVKHGAG